MDWFKKHTDAVMVISAMLGAVFWMNGKFTEVSERFNDLDRRLVRIETVLIMKGILPSDFAAERYEDK